MKYLLLIPAFIFISSNTYAQSAGGTLSSSTLVCGGANNGILSVSGYSGAVSRWEYSYAPTGPWTPMAHNSSSYNYINLTQSTYFKVIVQLPGYAEATSNSVLVACDNLSSSGTILCNTLQCINSPVTATLIANTGSVIAWEYSATSWITTNTITTTNTLVATLASLTTTTQIRAIVKNGVCPAVFSNTLTLFPAASSVGGNINGTQSVCANSNSATLTLTNYTGTIQYWESSLSVGGPYNIITNTTNTMSFSNLVQSTWYRVVVKNANCSENNSSPFAVHVDQISDGGSIIGTQNVCAVNNNGAVQLVAYTGSINQWQNSTNNGITWTVITNTSNTHGFMNIPSTSIYRAVVQNGICPSVTSPSHTVAVYSQPATNFSVNPGCVQTQINFTNTTSGSNSYVWDFGDGSSSNIFNPIHTFTSPGTYSVKLVAVSSQYCVDSLILLQTIYPKPSAGFISGDTSCFGNNMLFVNSSNILSGSITQLRFDFGDGSPSATVSPVTHLFLSEGNYSVFLKVKSNFGCIDSTNKLISVYPKPNSNFITANVCRGSQLSINNLSFITNGSMHHIWNFGNSSFSNLPSPSYTYPTAGNYIISLISTSNHNCKDTVFKPITINETPLIVLSSTNTCLGSPVFFTYSIQPSSLSMSMSLNFGDGNFSNGINPLHYYLNPGIFASSVTVVTDSGCVSSASKNTVVYSKPHANFNFSNICSSDSAKFFNTSSIITGTLSFLWLLTNTFTSTTNSPTYLYSVPGKYSITLIAKSNFDCADTSTQVLSSFEAPKTGFSFSNSCDGFPVTFSNTTILSSGNIRNYLWHFGDNSSSIEMHPTKEYLNPRTYTVTLITQSNEGCTDTLKKTLQMYEGPIADFSTKSVCWNETASFYNSSVMNLGNYTSEWNFGDNTTSDKNSPEHVFSKTGVYKVWLKVKSNYDCVDSVSKFIENFALPKITTLQDTAIEKGFGLYLQTSGALTYNWFPPDGLNDPSIANPFAIPSITTIYSVEGTDLNGCKNRDTIQVTVKDDFIVIPYNILTPDGNGMNDAFLIKNIETYPDNSLLIFDAWNQRVYETESYANTWTGKNMRGEILPDATYFYILKFKHTAKTYTGYITLMRNGQ